MLWLELPRVEEGLLPLLQSAVADVPIGVSSVIVWDLLGLLQQPAHFFKCCFFFFLTFSPSLYDCTWFKTSWSAASVHTGLCSRSSSCTLSSVLLRDFWKFKACCFLVLDLLQEAVWWWNPTDRLKTLGFGSRARDPAATGQGYGVNLSINNIFQNWSEDKYPVLRGKHVCRLIGQEQQQLYWLGRTRLEFHNRDAWLTWNLCLT